MFTESDLTESNLLCFLYGSAKEVELCQRCIEDALGRDDKLLAEFYREVQAQDQLRMWRIEELLHRYPIEFDPGP